MSNCPCGGTIPCYPCEVRVFEGMHRTPGDGSRPSPEERIQELEERVEDLELQLERMVWEKRLGVVLP